MNTKEIFLLITVWHPWENFLIEFYPPPLIYTVANILLLYQCLIVSTLSPNILKPYLLNSPEQSPNISLKYMYRV